MRTIIKQAHFRKSSIESLEAMLLMSASTIEGTDADEWISGDENDNTILAGGGNDEIHSPIGNNTIDGGSGNDTFVVYQGNRSNFSLSQLSDNSYLLQGPGLNGNPVSNRLINVENISFNDGVILLNTNSSQDGSSQPDTNAGGPTAPSTSNSDVVSLNGTNADDYIAGTEGNDIISAGAGNDNIYTPLGNNSIDGGSGLDTLLVYEGVRSQYSISLQADGSYQISGPGLNGQQQVNTLRNIEQIQFNDSSVDLQGNTFDSTPQQTFAPSAPQQAEAAPQTIDAPQEIEFVPETQPVVTTSQQPAVSDFVAEVVRLTNDIRSQNGLSQLTINLELQDAAVGHSQDLAFQDFFSHTGLDGQEPWDRAIEAGYNYRTIGENIAAGQLTPQEVVQAWFDSPSHRVNLLNPSFTEIGVGYTFLQNDTGNINFNHYWTQLLGSQQ